MAAVALLSLQAQLQAGATNIKPVQMLQYGADGPVDATRCTAIRFIPGSEGTVFAAAHISGTVIIHIKVALHKYTCHVLVLKIWQGSQLFRKCQVCSICSLNAVSNADYSILLPY